jgi:hypothetical protein
MFKNNFSVTAGYIEPMLIMNDIIAQLDVLVKQLFCYSWLYRTYVNYE